MRKFTRHRGIVAPLDRRNVDTDIIIPKQFLKSISRTGFGENLFDQLRYEDEGQPGMDNSLRPLRADFVLNREPFNRATILLARENFGCGSSREHAVWALADFGFRVVMAPSFAEIFWGNCLNNGILPVKLDDRQTDHLFTLCSAPQGIEVEVDLVEQRITLPDGETWNLSCAAGDRKRLLEGLDEIGMTLLRKERIEAFARKRHEQMPWLQASKNPSVSDQF